MAGLLARPPSCVLIQIGPYDRHGQRTFCNTDEINQLPHQWIAFVSFGDPLEPLPELAVAEKQVLVNFAVAMDVEFRDAAAAHADHIEADQFSERPLRQSKRNNVGADAAYPGYHRTFADAHELADGDAAAEIRMVADNDMTSQQNVVGKYDQDVFNVAPKYYRDL